MKIRDKLAFIERYGKHLWRCYKTIAEVKKRLDPMIQKVYSL
jgi:hypothetical protein